MTRCETISLQASSPLWTGVKKRTLTTPSQATKVPSTEVKRQSWAPNFLYYSVIGNLRTYACYSCLYQSPTRSSRLDFLSLNSFAYPLLPNFRNLSVVSPRTQSILSTKAPILGPYAVQKPDFPHRILLQPSQVVAFCLPIALVPTKQGMGTLCSFGTFNHSPSIFPKTVQF